MWTKHEPLKEYLEGMLLPKASRLSANSLKSLAGMGGFEPPNGGIKIRCLTTWLHPNRRWAILMICQGCKRDNRHELRLTVARTHNITLDWTPA